jgi:hypothetical protein
MPATQSRQLIDATLDGPDIGASRPRWGFVMVDKLRMPQQRAHPPGFVQRSASFNTRSFSEAVKRRRGAFAETSVEVVELAPGTSSLRDALATRPPGASPRTRDTAAPRPAVAP